jgi:hypothetical protein
VLGGVAATAVEVTGGRVELDGAGPLLVDAAPPQPVAATTRAPVPAIQAAAPNR